MMLLASGYASAVNRFLFTYSAFTDSVETQCSERGHYANQCPYRRNYNEGGVREESMGRPIPTVS